MWVCVTLIPHDISSGRAGVRLPPQSTGLLFVNSPLHSGRTQPACNYWLHLRGIPTGTDRLGETATTLRGISVHGTFSTTFKKHLQQQQHFGTSNERIVTLRPRIVPFTENILVQLSPDCLPYPSALYVAPFRHRHMAVRESCEPFMLPVDDSLVKRARKGGRNSGWTLHQLDTVWHAMWQRGTRFVKRGKQQTRKMGGWNYWN